MARKTFNIGEWAVGGILIVEATPREITIKALDYNTRKVVASRVLENRECSPWAGSIETRYRELLSTLDTTLNDWTSYYYADKVMNWIKDYLKNATK